MYFYFMSLRSQHLVDLRLRYFRMSKEELGINGGKLWRVFVRPDQFNGYSKSDSLDWFASFERVAQENE